MVYIPPLPGKEAMPRPGQLMPSLWPAPTNVPLGVAAPGRAGDEGAQSGENPEACPSKCPPLGTLDDRLLILPTATPWH